MTTSLADEQVTEGAATEARVTLTNRGTDTLPTPIAIVGLPGGLEVRHDQLKELVKSGRIAAYDAPPRGDEQVLDATDKIVAPGLIDMHVELREPGFEEDETIGTGTAAAIAVGYTSIACMPRSPRRCARPT